MDCSHIRQKISAYMDDELDDAATRLIGRHLERCPRCLECLRGLRGVDELVHGLATMDPGPDFTSRIVSAAMGMSDVTCHGSSWGSRLKEAVDRLSEVVLSLFDTEVTRSTHTLEEFSDCPPLSMGSIYFNLLGQGGRGC